MSIAIPTYAPGAISNYSELVDEIRDMMDDADYSQEAIDRALRKAEAWFNRELRTPDMEGRLVFDITAELTQLPDDFHEMRFIFVESQPDRSLASMSPAGMLSAYGGASGCPRAFAIEGRNLRVGPVGNVTVEMVYYQRLPGLSDATVSNWLLRKHPDLYVVGVLYYLYVRERDEAGEARAANMVVSIIESIQRNANSTRWGAAPLIPTGLRQVGYSRI